MSDIELPVVAGLARALSSPNPLIQIVLGPRQVGKTTSIKQLITREGSHKVHFVSADGVLPNPSGWLEAAWFETLSHNREWLVVDEVQKVEDWSEVVKKLWDQQVGSKRRLKLILLGSSSLSLRKGMSESLAGRYQVHNVYHWNPEESARAYALGFEDYLRYGGYPGSYRFADDKVAWLSYMRESIIDAVIGRDILSLVRVKSPALFRQCFQLASVYGGQEISYTKLLGQLQDRGNTDLIKSYLEHFEAAFLLRMLPKYSAKSTTRRASSPKILPMCPALYTVETDATLDAEQRGRSFEIAVGAALCRLPGRLYYWREKNVEVDYVYQFGKDVVAIEVKSGRKKTARGLSAFCAKFPKSRAVIVTPDNVHALFRADATDFLSLV